MELKVILQDQRTDLDAVTRSVDRAMQELVSDLGLEVKISCRVVSGQENRLYLGDEALRYWDRSIIPKIGEAPETGLFGGLFKWGRRQPEAADTDQISRCVMHSVMLQRWRLSKTALPAGAGPLQLRFVEELIRRCISLKWLEPGELQKLAERTQADLVSMAESLMKRAELKLLVPEGMSALDKVDFEEDGSANTRVRGEHPAASAIRREIRETHGLLLPGITELVDSESSHRAENHFQLKINDVRFPSIENNSAAGDQLRDQLSRNSASLVTGESTLLGLLLLKSGSDEHPRFPDLVDAVIETYGVDTITRVLRYLADEGANIGRLRAILDAMLEVVGTSAADEMTQIVIQPHIGKLYPALPGGPIKELQYGHIAECVRMSFGRQLAADAKQGHDGIRAFLLESDIERWLAMGDTDAGRDLSLIKALGQANTEHPEVNIILTNTISRRRLWEIIQPWFPQFRVLSFQELEADETIFGIDRIKLNA